MVAKDGEVVLFSGPGIGTSVREAESGVHKVGYYTESWGMQFFTDFNGTVTLENSRD
jgi:hypothetical protein